MASEALNLIPYALIAAASPLGLAATLAVLRTGRGQALRVAAGVLVGQLLACGVFVAIGAAIVQPHREEQPHVEGVIEVCLGVGLLAIGLLVHRRQQEAEPHGSHPIVERLAHVRGVTAFVAGLALGVGGPKRLVLTSLASASITAAGLGAARDAAFVLWYSVLATSVVWLPVSAAVIVGQPALDRIDAALHWLGQHRRPLTFYSLLGVSLFLLAHGLLLLVPQG